MADCSVPRAGMDRRVLWRWLMCLATLALSIAPRVAAQRPPLHERIDLLAARWQIGPAASVTSDAAFFRRVSLDLLGRTPTRAELHAFLSDPAPGKRERCVDRMLSSPEFVWHMVDRFDVMWMERRTDQTVKTQQWRDFLASRIRSAEPLNRLAYQILIADGADAATRGAARFYLGRGGELNLLTRDVGRMFFGRDLQCAQCHDHPLVQDYYQADYYGLASCLTRSFVFTDPKSKQKLFAERAEGDVSYQSVFTGERRVMARRLPGEPLRLDPAIDDDKRYKVAPAKNVRPIPAYSRREAMAREATGGANAAFNRNLANRLWSWMMGRGLVDPPDLHSLDALPTHPELLDDLAQTLVESSYDLRFFLREIALSQTYQRSVDLPADLQPSLALARSQQAKWAAEAEALLKARDEVAAQVEALREEFDTAAEAWTNASDQRVAAQKALAAAEKAAAKPVAAWNQARDSARQLEQRRAVLQKAVAAVAAAAKQLPDDVDLAKTVTLFQQRLTKADAAWKQAAAKESQLRTAAEQATKKVDDARARVASAQSAERAAAEKVAAVDKKQTELAGKLNQLAAQAFAAQSRVHRAKHLLEWGRIAEQHQAVANDVRNWTQQLQTAQSTLASTSERAQSLRSQLDELTAAKAAAEQEMLTLQSAKATLERRHAALKQALAAAQAAQTASPDDQAIKDAVQLLNQKTVDAAKRLTAQVAAVTQRLADVDKLAAQLREAQKQQQAVDAERARAAELITKAQAALPKLTAQLRSLAENRDRAYAMVRSDAEQSLVIGRLRPLTPEQLAWSAMSTTGVLEEQRRAVRAERDKKSPLDAKAQQDPQAVAARDYEIEFAARAKLQGNVNAFVSVFGAAPGQPQEEFFATADQALFLTNGALVRSWLSASPQRLVGQLNAVPDTNELAEQLYEAVFSRSPTQQERQDIEHYLKPRTADRPQAIAEIVSALLASAEYRFNH